MTRVLLEFLFAAAFLSSLLACSRNAATVVSFSGETMGTTYQIKIVDSSEQELNSAELQGQVEDILDDINQSMSTYLVDSELNQLNRAPIQQWLPVSEPLFQVLYLSQNISQTTLGAFDITVAPLVDLWGFGSPGEAVAAPSADAIEDSLTRVGYNKLKLAVHPELKVLKQTALQLDLSAIAKGYAVDSLAALLKKLNFKHFLIEVGGELYAAGLNAEQESWRLGVEKPSLLRSGALQVISVSDLAVATSGDYRNYYEINGRRVSHTIDADTGSPIEHNLASVTVVAESAALADGLATGLNVLGPERGLALAQSEDIAAYFILRVAEGFDVKYTGEFEKYLD